MTRSYYFAGCKLDIEGKSDSLGPMEKFANEQPFSYEINCRLAPDEPLPGIDTVCSLRESETVGTSDGGWLFCDKEDEPKGGLWADRTYSRLISYGEDGKKFIGDGKKEGKFYRLRMIFDAILPLHGGTALHASCVKYRGECMCFCAPAGTGKSTHARQWEEAFGAPMLSSDTPTIFPHKEGGATAYGMPWDGSDNVITQESLPVRAIVELRHGKKNSMRRLTPAQAYRMLLGQGHMPMWDEETMFVELAVLKRLSRSVPFYRLCCLPEPSAARLVEAVLYGGDRELSCGPVADEDFNAVFERCRNIEDSAYFPYIKEETEMKVKEGFVLRDVMDDHIVMPTGANMKKFEGALVLSGTSAFVWEKLQNNISRTELLNAVLEEYDIDRETAEKDLDGLIEKLKEFDVLEELD